MHLTLDPAIPLRLFIPKIHLLKTMNNIFTRFFITALIIIAKYWQLPIDWLHQPVRIPITQHWWWDGLKGGHLFSSCSRGWIKTSAGLISPPCPHMAFPLVFPSCNDTSYIGLDIATSLNLSTSVRALPPNTVTFLGVQRDLGFN